MRLPKQSTTENEKKMRIIRARHFPPKGFKAINLFGIVIARKDVKLTAEDIRHEEIHTRQMREMLYIPFYIWYLMEWLYRLVFEINAYRSISFEREAYEHEDEPGYLESRRPYAWRHYL